MRNPTIILIADRVQLVAQTYDQFRTADMPRMQTPDNAAQLRATLKADQRGLIFTTVHKFQNAGLLNDRDNVIVLVDEAHRSQEKQLGQHLRSALPNARFFGFTGTPIADLDRNTFKLFGDPEDPGHALNTLRLGPFHRRRHDRPDPRAAADGGLSPRQGGPRNGVRGACRRRGSR